MNVEQLLAKKNDAMNRLETEIKELNATIAKQRRNYLQAMRAKDEEIKRLQDELDAIRWELDVRNNEEKEGYRSGD